MLVKRHCLRPSSAAIKQIQKGLEPADAGEVARHGRIEADGSVQQCLIGAVCGRCTCHGADGSVSSW